MLLVICCSSTLVLNKIESVGKDLKNSVLISKNKNELYLAKIYNLY